MPRRKKQETTPEEPRQEETQQEELPMNTGYPVADTQAKIICAEGKCYPVRNGRIDCPPEVAAKLRRLGMLK